MLRSLALPVALAGLALLLGGCSRHDTPPAPDRPVKLMTVGSSSAAPGVELAGDVRARVESSLGFRVAGKIISRHVETGQRVHKGEELARLDPRDFQLSDQAAVAQLSSATAQMETARAEYARYDELRRKGYVSANDLDRKRAERSAAEAQHQQAASGMDMEKNRLGDTVLRADADGVVTAVLADVGEGVNAGQPVIRVAQDGPREIEVEFPEDRIALAHVAHARATLWARPGEVFPASLRELSAAADPVTRTFRARYTVQAPPAALALGQSATLHLQVPAMTSGAVRLPTTAIFGQKDVTTVWIYDPASSQIKRQPVQVVGVDGNDVLVAGLPAGVQVVTAGVHVLSDGQKVKPFAASMTN